MKTILNILIVVGIVLLYVTALNSNVNKIEKRECQDWQVTKPPYAWAQWQIDQCNHHSTPLPR